MRAGRRPERGSARFGSKLEAALARLGSPADVLARHGIKMRRREFFCPFHDDIRKPAGSLYRGRDGKERWKCHVCLIGGDALDLEARLSGRSIKDLLRELA
jgi:hypothetical protein